MFLSDKALVTRSWQNYRVLCYDMCGFGQRLSGCKSVSPTLIFVSELDDDSIKQMGDLLAECIPKGKKEMIAEAARLPCMERPKAFNLRAFAFLKQVNPQGEKNAAR